MNVITHTFVGLKCLTETKMQILFDHVDHTRFHIVEMGCQMIQLLSAHIVGPTMFVNFDPPPYHPPEQILKPAEFRPMDNFFCQIPGGRASPGPLILIILHFFTIFKTSIINLPIEYLQIHRKNTDLSMKDRQKSF